MAPPRRDVSSIIYIISLLERAQRSAPCLEPGNEELTHPGAGVHRARQFDRPRALAVLGIDICAELDESAHRGEVARNDRMVQWCPAAVEFGKEVAHACHLPNTECAEGADESLIREP